MMIKCWLLVLVVDEKGGFCRVKFLGVAFFLRARGYVCGYGEYPHKAK